MNSVRSDRSTILIVEDSPEISELLELALEGREYVIESVNSLEAALERWSKNEGNFDLLLTDLNLGTSGSGAELARSLLAVKPSLKVMVTSGACLPRRITLPGRQVDILHKPFTLTAVRTAVAAALRGNGHGPSGSLAGDNAILLLAADRAYSATLSMPHFEYENSSSRGNQGAPSIRVSD
jgi:DNA-binding response OmpR family regulator